MAIAFVIIGVLLNVLYQPIPSMATDVALNIV